MKTFFGLMFFAGCNDAHNKSDNYPIESVNCEHPDSRYEAVVIVSVDDAYQWKEINFTISQEGSDWSTSLWLPEEHSKIWDTRMQLYELDCTSEYSYEFEYVK